jgi:HAD superfamily hydrolase (TIGR01662 family)
LRALIRTLLGGSKQPKEGSRTVLHGRLTNESGVARGYCTAEDVERFHAAMWQQLLAHCTHIDCFYYCPFHPEGSVAEYAIDHEDRKPSSGMLLRAIREWPADVAASVLIGDTENEPSGCSTSTLDEIGG